MNLKNNDNSDNKNKDLFIRPNNSCLMNHLKKENEKLRKLIISYELKNKKNIYKLNINKKDLFKITKTFFQIIKKPKEINNNKNFNKNIKREYNYKNDFSKKGFELSKNIKSLTNMKRHDIRRIKDINCFDNDYNYIKGKENFYKKYTNTQIYNNKSLKERNSSLSQRNRHLLNINDNKTINSNAMRVKNVIINKNINNYIIKPVHNNLNTNRSHLKVIKKRKINDDSFLSNTAVKTVENRKTINSSCDRNNLFKSSNSKQRQNRIVPKPKNNEKIREIYYQKPIINKITIYNNINNNGFNNTNNYMIQKSQINEKAGKKQNINRFDNYKSKY